MIDRVRTEVVIIGAGPYALSLAAHLRALGVDFRIFGTPMHTWRALMPRGMFLKSEWRASDLFDPVGSCTLEQFCAREGIVWGSPHSPVPLETFTRYGLHFQQRFVPEVEDVMVTALDGEPSHFEVQLADGETLRVNQVVVATGMSHAAHVPRELTRLPAEVLSHSGRHHDLTRFTGRSVAVIGGGQSALETAALLHEAGAEVRLVTRNDVPSAGHRSLYQRLRRPMSKLGPGLGPWLYCNAPQLFRCLPQGVRIARVKSALGPAGAWWLKDRVVGRLSVLAGHSLEGAEVRGDGALLHLQASDGTRRQVAADHVIAATGYRFALGSVPFLGRRLLDQLRAVEDAPVLSPNFESSVAGLYFTGLASANTFGPAMRFLHGAGFTARRLSRRLASGGRFRWLFRGRGGAGTGCAKGAGEAPSVGGCAGR